MQGFLDGLKSTLLVILVGFIFGAGLPSLYALSMKFAYLANKKKNSKKKKYLYKALTLLLLIIVIAIIILGILFITKDALRQHFGINIF